MLVKTLLTKKNVNREEVQFILDNQENFRQAALESDNSKIKRRWESVLGKRRIEILEAWVQGIWIEDKDGEYCTAWRTEIQLQEFSCSGVRMATTVRIKRKANNEERKKALLLEEFIKTYSLNTYQSREANKDAAKLRDDQYEWISVEQYLKSDKSKILSVLGAELI